MPFKQWSFGKAKWSHYIAITNKFAKNLLPPDLPDVNQVYQDFCNIINSAAKRSISRGHQKDHKPCWDSECENLNRVFLRSDGNNSSGTAAALLTRLDRKRRDRWSEAAQNIDFSHSSRKAKSILNNHIGRSRHSSRHCSASADAIASQLIRNRRYEDVNCASSRLIFQEVSDF